MRRIIILTTITLLILTLLFLTASKKSEYCQCQFVTDCDYRSGIGMRYWQCAGACVGYSQWKPDFRCAPQVQNYNENRAE